MNQDVQLAVQGDVAFLQLVRPSRGNAFRASGFDELRKLAVRLGDAPPSFLVVTAEGPDFCVGLDLDSVDGLGFTFGPLVESRDAYRVQEVVTRLRGAFDSLARLPCPILAAVEGRCLGVGFELALMADLRIASESTTFGLPGVREGVLTGLGGLANLSALVGVARAQDIVLTSRVMPAQEAYECGLVSQVCDDGAARAAALDLVAELRRASPAARLQTLLAMRAIRQRIADEVRDTETQCAARTWIAGDWQHGA